jgi:hypothetical protein
MKPNKPRAPEVKSRTPGSGCRHLDERLFPAIDKLIEYGKAATAEEAARQLADEGRVYGSGTAENRARRLARRYRDAQETIRIPRRAAGESANAEPMSTRTRPTPPAGKLIARLMIIEGAYQRLLDAQGAMAHRVGEVEIMLAEVLESNTRLRRENEELRAELKRLADAAEARLDRLARKK